MKNIFLTAIQFLTIIPIKVSVTEESYAKSPMFFPTVGFIIGVILIIFLKLFSLVFPKFLVAALILTILTFITGGLHLDGLGDFFDAFKGGRTKEKILKIMEDPRIGVIGTIAICLILILKFTSILNILKSNKISFLILAPALGRWAIVELCFFSHPASETGLGAPHIEGVGLREFLFALFSINFILTFFCGLLGFLLFAFVFIFDFIFLKYCEKKISGITGDILGAGCELTETFAFVLGGIKFWKFSPLYHYLVEIIKII